MKLSDYVFDFLTKLGIKHVFGVVGGANTHLADSLMKNPNIRFICTQHEQGAAIAAEGYARTKGELAVVSVTSGPGGTNALTGVIGQWIDSVPVLYLSGQVKYETTISSDPDCCLRQLGDQEINIIRAKYKKVVGLKDYDDIDVVNKPLYIAPENMIVGYGYMTNLEEFKAVIRQSWSEFADKIMSDDADNVLYLLF